MAGIATLITKYGVKVVNISERTNHVLCILAASDGNKDAQAKIRGQAESAATILNRLLDNGHEFVICVAAGNQNNTVFYKDSTAQFSSTLDRIYGYTTDSGIFSGTTEHIGADAQYNHYLNYITDERLRDRIIVVGSIGLADDGSYYSATSSNTGDRVDIMAPGVNIYSTYYGNQYGSLSGTSMATPHVSGVAALLFATDTSLTGAEVKQILCETADYSTSFDGVSAGLLQVDAAVEAVLSKPTNTVTVTKFFSMTYDEIAALPWDEFYYYTSFDQPGNLYAQATYGDATLDFSFTYYDETAYLYTLYVRDELNGAGALPITSNISTGMTYAELADIVNVNDLTTDASSWSATCYPEQGCFMTLYFEGYAENAVLTGAKIEYFE